MLLDSPADPRPNTSPQPDEISASAVVLSRHAVDDERMKGRRLTAWLVVALTAGIVAGTGTLATTSHGLDPGWGLYVIPLAVGMSTGVGVVLATRLSANPIGWLLLANGLVL